ncbi:MAG: hypothetical protein NHB32_13530 [Fischerella sp. CENA71]|nr:hypothetical protein [Fischerella sp. CENA71]
MFNRPFERELLDEEIWLFGQQSKMPPHLQKLAERELGRQDIWELPNEESPRPHHVPNKKLKRFWILGLRF